MLPDFKLLIKSFKAWAFVFSPSASNFFCKFSKATSASSLIFLFNTSIWSVRFLIICGSALKDLSITSSGISFKFSRNLVSNSPTCVKFCPKLVISLLFFKPLAKPSPTLPKLFSRLLKILLKL